MNKEERLKEYIEEDEIYQDYKNDRVNTMLNLSDFDKFCIQHCKDIEELLEENKKLKKQIDYIRSGEYYNQLRFENEMLQQVVDTNGVPSEVYDYIDCTHRNTELLKENEKIKDDFKFERIINCQLDKKLNKAKQEREQLIKYLEERIKKENNFDFTESIIFKNGQCIKIDTLKEILDKVKSGDYSE